ncbi:MAG: DUF4399 domain-containing protein [Hyphomicrobiales bacterium]
MKNFLIAPTVIAMMISGTALAGETPSAKNATQYIVNIEDGDIVSSPVKVIFGLSGMGVAPAGVEKELTGHHHILLNRSAFGKGEDGVEEFEFNLPADEQHIHFGKGQTEATLDLEPGQHTIQLVLGDNNHIPHNPPVYSEVITINVQ